MFNQVDCVKERTTGSRPWRCRARFARGRGGGGAGGYALIQMFFLVEQYGEGSVGEHGGCGVVAVRGGTGVTVGAVLGAGAVHVTVETGIGVAAEVATELVDGARSLRSSRPAARLYGYRDTSFSGVREVAVRSFGVHVEGDGCDGR